MTKTRAARSGAGVAAPPAGGGSAGGGGGGGGGGIIIGITLTPAAPVTLTSKFRGVSFDKKDRRWRAQFTNKSKSTCLGSFDTEEGAARAYDRAMMWCKAHEVERHGGIVLNFPEEEGDEVDAELKDMSLADLVKKLRRRGGRKHKHVNSTSTSKY